MSWKLNLKKNCTNTLTLNNEQICSYVLLINIFNDLGMIFTLPHSNLYIALTIVLSTIKLKFLLNKGFSCHYCNNYVHCPV